MNNNLQWVTIPKIKKRFKIIENEISQLVEDKYYFKKYTEYVAQSKKIDKQNDFLFFIAKNYQILALINVCKQADEDSRSESFINLLKDISGNTHLFTLEKFTNKYQKFMKSCGIEDFKKFSVRDNSRISKRKIDDDVIEIKRKIRGLRFGRKRQSNESLYKYRNKRGAHFSKGMPKISVRVRQLDEAINLLESKVLKYNLLINQTGMETLLPSNIDDFCDLANVFKS